MGNISKGIQAATLRHTADWYLTAQALQDANDAIIGLKNERALPELHRKDAHQLHTASDGQKILLTQDSLNATYSAKYPGVSKASSINTAVDERFVLFYSAVITAADREAVNMIDMHLGSPVVKSTIHSTAPAARRYPRYFGSGFRGNALAGYFLCPSHEGPGLPGTLQLCGQKSLRGSGLGDPARPLHQRRTH